MALLHEPTHEPLGVRMAKVRSFAQVSKKAMALRLGVDPKTIYHWETGKTYPPIDKVAAYAALSPQFPMSYFTDGLVWRSDGTVTQRYRATLKAA